jgi:uncharacterized protein YpuA (DUF1002 family)
MHGGKPVNVSSSITPIKGERLTDSQSKLQWADVDWKKVEEHVNRLQARITKAVKEINCCPIQKRVMKCLSGMKGNFHVPF